MLAAQKDLPLLYHVMMISIGKDFDEENTCCFLFSFFKMENRDDNRLAAFGLKLASWDHEYFRPMQVAPLLYACRAY